MRVRVRVCVCVCVCVCVVCSGTISKEELFKVFVACRHKFSKVFTKCTNSQKYSPVILCGKYTRALTFENCEQPRGSQPRICPRHH
jgi:hypothetical protein